MTTNQAVSRGSAVTGPAVSGESGVSAELVAELLRRVSAMEIELEELRAKVDANVSEDVVLAICAAVAAFLGKRATVRQIHLVGDTTWAREGRAYVQSVHSASRRR